MNLRVVLATVVICAVSVGSGSGWLEKAKSFGEKAAGTVTNVKTKVGSGAGKVEGVTKKIQTATGVKKPDAATTPATTKTAASSATTSKEVAALQKEIAELKKKVDGLEKKVDELLAAQSTAAAPAEDEALTTEDTPASADASAETEPENA